MGTVALFNGSIPFSACRVNSPLVCVALVSFPIAQEARAGGSRSYKMRNGESFHSRLTSRTSLEKETTAMQDTGG